MPAAVRRATLAALVLFASACAAPGPADEPSVARKDPAPEPVEEANERVRALLEAYLAERWEEVIEGSAAAFEASTSPRGKWQVLAATARSSFGLRRWEECARVSRKCLDWAAESPVVEATSEWIQSLVLIEAESLLALDWAGEVERRLEEGARREPTLRESARWRLLRLAALPGDGVMFDLAPVAPSEARAFQEGKRRLEQATSRAMDNVRRRLAAPELAFPPIRLSVVAGGIEKEVPLLAANAVSRGSGWVGVIWIRRELVLHPSHQDEQLLAHELAHVLHLAGTGAKARELPSWLLEGLAHWVESENDLEHRDMVLGMATRASGSPGTSVSALLQSEAEMAEADEDSERVSGAVVFFQLERMLGRPAVQRLVLRLLKERDWAAVLREETRMDLPRLLEEVRAGYLEWAAATFPGRGALLEASRRADSGDVRGAVQDVDAFLEGPTDDPTRWLAEVFRLNLLVKLEDWPAARVALAPIHALRRSRPLAGTVGQGVMSEVAVLRGSGDWAGLAALVREARESLWVRDPEWRAELDEALAEAEKHLAEAAAPKEPGK